MEFFCAVLAGVSPSVPGVDRTGHHDQPAEPDPAEPAGSADPSAQDFPALRHTIHDAHRRSQHQLLGDR